MAKILITGGTGLIGHRLAHLLVLKGYDINVLTRRKSRHHNHHPTHDGVTYFPWDIEKGEIDNEAFEEVTAIVHLAGVNIAAKKWSPQQKKDIVESRVKSAGFIYN